MGNQEQGKSTKPDPLENAAPLLQQSAHSVPTMISRILQQTGFIGRAHELETIEEHLRNPECRLLTLTGLGGVGKTRLAIEAAQRQQTIYAHGVQIVFFQSLSSPDIMVSSIASAIGFQFYIHADSKQQLLDYFRDKSMLLVMDNLEHLLEGVSLLSEILSTSPHIRILATSRERLNLLEEWVFEVRGLSYPSSEAEPEIETYDALKLFLECARRTQIGFTLTSKQKPAAIRICRLVGGMPLGIELAAAWVRALPCEAIANEIEKSLDILESPTRNVEPRHRTMRAAFEPTWARLSDEERHVFKRLSVFRGGFTREAAEHVAGASLQTLSALFSKSCLRHDLEGRFDLHELLRQYAEEKLKASGETESARTRHCAYYAEFMNNRLPDVKGRRQIEALAEITVEFQNVQAAWMWASEHRHVHTIESMLESLWHFCEIRNHEHENKTLFRFAERAFSDESLFERLRGRLLARMWEELETQEYQLNHALQIARRYDDLAEIAFCTMRLSDVANERYDHVRAKQLLEQSLEAFSRLGDRYGIAETLFKLMTILMYFDYEGMFDDFIRYGKESLRLRQEIGDHVGTAWALAPVAHGETRAGRFAEAERLWWERIRLGQRVGIRSLVALGYAHISYSVYFPLGDFANARMTAEEAIKLGREIGFSNPIKFGQVTLGLLASMEERYQEAETLCKEAASNIPLKWIISTAAWGSVIAACGLEDEQALDEYFPVVLKFHLHMMNQVGLVLCLPIAAILFARRGDEEYAVELLALAATHPVRASGWMEKWPLLTRLRIELEERLGSEVYTIAWIRGTQLNADEVKVELLQQFQEKQLDPRNSKTLSSFGALSEREMEVLRLVAEGNSNQEIANRLYIGVSTVKKHINHIYDKLDAKNRTQAVAAARERHILI